MLCPPTLSYNDVQFRAMFPAFANPTNFTEAMLQMVLGPGHKLRLEPGQLRLAHWRAIAKRQPHGPRPGPQSHDRPYRRDLRACRRWPDPGAYHRRRHR